MFIHTWLKTTLSLALFILFIQQIFAQDWPQWRGANRDGAVTGFTAPKTWPDQLKQIWKVSVGVGHSSPLVIGARVYLHSRQAENEVAAAYDLDTGKTIWQDSYPVAYTMNQAAAGHGKGPKSTPVYSNGKLYTLGITGVLSCYDTANGKPLWRKDFAKQFKSTSPVYGAAASPIIDRGLLIAHVGGADGGALKALDAKSGEEKTNSGTVAINNYVRPGSPVVAAGLKVPVAGLTTGAYKVEVKALDSAGNFAVRTADFQIE